MQRIFAAAQVAHHRAQPACCAGGDALHRRRAGCGQKRRRRRRCGSRRRGGWRRGCASDRGGREREPEERGLAPRALRPGEKLRDPLLGSRGLCSAVGTRWWPDTLLLLVVVAGALAPAPCGRRRGEDGRERARGERGIELLADGGVLSLCARTAQPRARKRRVRRRREARSWEACTQSGVAEQRREKGGEHKREGEKARQDVSARPRASAAQRAAAASSFVRPRGQRNERAQRSAAQRAQQPHDTGAKRALTASVRASAAMAQASACARSHASALPS